MDNSDINTATATGKLIAAVIRAYDPRRVDRNAIVKQAQSACAIARAYNSAYDRSDWADRARSGHALRSFNLHHIVWSAIGEIVGAS